MAWRFSMFLLTERCIQRVGESQRKSLQKGVYYCIQKQAIFLIKLTLCHLFLCQPTKATALIQISLKTLHIINCGLFSPSFPPGIFKLYCLSKTIVKEYKDFQDFTCLHSLFQKNKNTTEAIIIIYRIISKKKDYSRQFF